MSRTFVLAAIISFMAIDGVYAQQRNLLKDLKTLNVRRRTTHYALAGTVSDARLAEYGRALEYVHRVYRRGFANLNIKPKPVDGETQDGQPPRGETQDGRFHVVILAPAGYEEFADEYFGFGTGHTTNGLFVAKANLLIARHTTSADTIATLFHEGFHQFLHRYLPEAPIWINEGLAYYYGTARATRSGLVFDQPRIDLFRYVRDARDKRQLTPLKELMREKTFGLLGNAQSYTLVAYMLQDEGGRMHLQRYLKSLVDVTTPEELDIVNDTVFPQHLLDAIVDPWLRVVEHSGRR